MANPFKWFYDNTFKKHPGALYGSLGTGILCMILGMGIGGCYNSNVKLENQLLQRQNKQYKALIGVYKTTMDTDIRYSEQSLGGLDKTIIDLGQAKKDFQNALNAKKETRSLMEKLK